MKSLFIFVVRVQPLGEMSIIAQHKPTGHRSPLKINQQRNACMTQETAILKRLRGVGPCIV